MNGCMTAALELEKAIDFVAAIVNQAGASGVVGTEITIFEPLTTRFPQAFLKHIMGNESRSASRSSWRAFRCCCSSIR